MEVVENQRRDLLLNNRSLLRLYQLYYPQITSLEELAIQPVLPQEDVFLRLSVLPVQVSIDYFGIILPSNQWYIENFVENYVRDNLAYYAKILTRGQVQVRSIEDLAILAEQGEVFLQNYLLELKDTEMLQILRVMVPFRSKPDQLTNTYQAFLEPTFMLLGNPSLSRSVNAVTLSGHDIKDISVTMLAFGTPVKYLTYELADFRNAVRERVLYHPEQPTQRFTFKEMRSLRTLLNFLSPSVIGVNELFLRVNDISSQVV